MVLATAKVRSLWVSKSARAGAVAAAQMIVAMIATRRADMERAPGFGDRSRTPASRRKIRPPGKTLSLALGRRRRSFSSGQIAGSRRTEVVDTPDSRTQGQAHNTRAGRIAAA